jgi:hypothetical protein
MYAELNRLFSLLLLPKSNCNSLCSWIDLTSLLFSLENFEFVIWFFDGQRDMHRKASIHEMGVRIIGGFLQYARIWKQF